MDRINISIQGGDVICVADCGGVNIDEQNSVLHGYDTGYDNFQHDTSVRR